MKSVAAVFRFVSEVSIKGELSILSFIAPAAAGVDDGKVAESSTTRIVRVVGFA